MKTVVSALIIILTISLPSFGQDPEIQVEISVKIQVQELIKRVERIEKENSELKKEVLKLNNILTEQKLSTDETKIDDERQNPDNIIQSAKEPPQPSRKDLAAVDFDLNKSKDFGLHPGGGGFFLKDGDHEFRILGYVQFLASIFDDSLDRDDEPGDFSIRRARIDFIATLFTDWELLVEFDGGPGTTNTGSSDFALVEARLNWKLFGDDIQLRTGKFITQFSTENARSSRAIDTVERYMALNSMFLLPALDVQFGMMLHGKLLEQNRLSYSLGVYNGNGKANDNLSDNNGSKELQAKVGYRFPKNVSLSFAFDFSDEEEQTVAIADLGFNRYVSVPIEGKRLGFGSDLFWEYGPYSFRSEFLSFVFDSPEQDEVWLTGGFMQPAYFIFGSKDKGLQTLLRGEFSHLGARTKGDGDTLYALTTGLNWFINPNIRLQIDGIVHYFDGPSEIREFSSSNWIPMLLAELQYKF